MYRKQKVIRNVNQYMLHVNDKAPDFRCLNQRGETISLSTYQGKKCILYFYPKDNTPGCTEQACNLSDNYKQLQANGFVVLGISQDTVKKHQNFIQKFNLPFDLLADTEHQIAELYGVWGEKKLYGRTYMGVIRTTFMIDENGFISNIIRDVKTANHAAQILE